MVRAARAVSPGASALIGLLGLASAMGVGRFAFTPLLPLMQQVGTLTLAQGGSLARANYLGYLVGAAVCMLLNPAPGQGARASLVGIALLTAGMGVTRSFAAWLALRFLAGVASAFVLVGVSSWVLPRLAAQGRAAWAGRVYAGVGLGMFFCGLVALATGVLRFSPDSAWLALSAVSAVVAVCCWNALGAESSAEPASRAAPTPIPPGTGWLVLAYGSFGFGYIVPATFLPAAARQVVHDPAVFAWMWPVFGLAAAISTVLASHRWREVAPRKLWAGAQAVMVVGVLVPAFRMNVATLLWCAVSVGGTFMVTTMAGIQEARRVAGASAPRLIAAMTAAFATGQLIGPFTVTSLGSSSSPGIALPHGIAAAVLTVGLALLALGPASASALAPSLQIGDRT